MSLISRTSTLFVVLVVPFALFSVQGKSLDKRSAESLYDNIYSAIADFTDNDNNDKIHEGDALPALDRPSRRAQFNGNANNNFQNAPLNVLPRQGRQQQTRQVVVDGFPAGLPQGTPRGVQIALASAQNLPPGEMPPIPGEAGVDYPVLTTVPETGFDCNSQNFLPGIYADTGADCQVFYMCQADGNFNGFLCPNGTIFNQQYFICDWWYNVDCSANPNFYGLNEFLYQDQPQGSFNSGFDGSSNNVDLSSAGSEIGSSADNFVGGSFEGGNGVAPRNPGNNQGNVRTGGGLRNSNNGGGLRTNTAGNRNNNNNLPAYGQGQGGGQQATSSYGGPRAG